ncbi:MAG: Molybdenum ABC transporter permease protein ModB, partial [uncultured Rubrobacteraceae bacterium]
GTEQARPASPASRPGRRARLRAGGRGAGATRRVHQPAFSEPPALDGQRELVAGDGLAGGPRRLAPQRQDHLDLDGDYPHPRDTGGIRAGPGGVSRQEDRRHLGGHTGGAAAVCGGHRAAADLRQVRAGRAAPERLRGDLELHHRGGRDRGGLRGGTLLRAPGCRGVRRGAARRGGGGDGGRGGAVLGLREGDGAAGVSGADRRRDDGVGPGAWGVRGDDHLRRKLPRCDADHTAGDLRRVPEQHRRGGGAVCASAGLRLRRGPERQVPDEESNRLRNL